MGFRHAFVLIVTVGLAGCLQSELDRCASGRVCPAGTSCDDANDRCVSDEQIAECAGMPDMTPCQFGGAAGQCEAGVCVPDACGDLRVTGTEDCEPGLGVGETDCTTLGYYEPGGLACGDDCRYDESRCVGECGDGERNGPEPCEGSDHGGSTCETFGYYQADGIVCNPASCTFDLSGCSGRCGDGVIDVAEGESCEGSTAPPGSCVDFGFDAGSLRCSGFCTPGFAACGRFGWRWEDSGAPTINLFGVWASGLDDIYLVGAQGTIVHGHSGAWTSVTTGSQLDDVFGFGGEVFAVGRSGQIQRRDPVSGEWAAMSIATSADFFDVWGVAADDLWAVGETIARYDGTSWTVQALPGGVGTLNGMHGSAADDIWAVGVGGTIAHWDGVAWASVTSPTTSDLHDVWVSGPADAWAGGGELLHWDGTAWSVVFASDAEPIDAMWGAHRNDVTAVTYAGTAYHWNGVSWSVETLEAGGINALHGVEGVLIGALSGAVAFREPTTWLESPPVVPGFVEAWSASPDDAWAVAADGTLHHWDGMSWTPVVIGASLDDVWGAASDDVWAVGPAGALWHFDGDGWSSRPDAGTENLTGLWGTGPDDIWVFGQGTFLHWNGATWSPVDVIGGTSSLEVWGSGPDDIWTIGGFGTMRHFDGTNWVHSETILSYEHFAGLWGTAADDVWAVSGTGLLFHYDGTAWTQSTSLLIPVSALWGSAPDDILAVGNLGRAMHYDGTAWAPIRSQVDFFPREIWGDPAELAISGERGTSPVLTRLARHTRWSCREREIACGDAIDDDCDERVDADDEDCHGGVVLGEVHGGAEDYVELRNRTGATASLAGLTVEWSGCSSGSHRLDGRALVKDGEAYRVIRDRTPGRREQWDGALCDAPDAGGWVMLCAGPCDRVACTNVLDFVAKTGTSAPSGEPGCAGMTEGPVSVTGATAAHSLQRIAFTTAGAKGATTDWAIGTASRD